MSAATVRHPLPAPASGNGHSVSARARLGLLLCAGLVALGLLWALGAAVRQVVRQADAHHAHTAAHAEATWRCSQLARRGDRDGCRQRASAVQVDNADLSR